MNEEQLRELLSRSEGPTLDFKTEHGSKEELAKDVMAIANVLRNGERGYLLFGVDENAADHTGVVVGLKAPPPDDANLHTCIKHLLNRMPAFTYEVVQVDALAVSVLEIRGEGRRPYFPLRDSGTVLARHVARKRIGSSTDIPSPTEMIEWAREDDPVLHENAVLELEEKKRDRQAQFNVRFARPQHQSWPAVVVENVGRCNIVAEVIEVQWRSPLVMSRCAAERGSRCAPAHGPAAPRAADPLRPGA
jgi:predicted HTH transcriptional regulator